jgi:hypothetical protein
MLSSASYILTHFHRCEFHRFERHRSPPSLSVARAARVPNAVQREPKRKRCAADPDPGCFDGEDASREHPWRTGRYDGARQNRVVKSNMRAAVHSLMTAKRCARLTVTSITNLSAVRYAHESAACAQQRLPRTRELPAGRGVSEMSTVSPPFIRVLGRSKAHMHHCASRRRMGDWGVYSFGVLQSVAAHVRFTPTSGKKTDMPAGPGWAIRRHPSFASIGKRVAS